MSNDQTTPLQRDEQIDIITSEFSNLLYEHSQNSSNSSLCPLCRSLTFSTLLSGYETHTNLSTLIINSFSCPLCRLLIAALDQPSENWRGDEQPLLSDVVSAILVRDATDLNKFPERLEVRVSRPPDEVEKLLQHDPYAENPEIRFVKHVVVCVDASKFPVEYGWNL
jgi:hypothetical protein